MLHCQYPQSFAQIMEPNPIVTHAEPVFCWVNPHQTLHITLSVQSESIKFAKNVDCCGTINGPDIAFGSLCPIDLLSHFL
jgi:hypothetical protein